MANDVSFQFIPGTATYSDFYSDGELGLASEFSKNYGDITSSHCAQCNATGKEAGLKAIPIWDFDTKIREFTSRTRTGKEDVQQSVEGYQRWAGAEVYCADCAPAHMIRLSASGEVSKAQSSQIVSHLSKVDNISMNEAQKRFDEARAERTSFFSQAPIWMGEHPTSLARPDLRIPVKENQVTFEAPTGITQLEGIVEADEDYAPPVDQDASDDTLVEEVFEPSPSTPRPISQPTYGQSSAAVIAQSVPAPALAMSSPRAEPNQTRAYSSPQKAGDTRSRGRFDFKSNRKHLAKSQERAERYGQRVDKLKIQSLEENLEIGEFLKDFNNAPCLPPKNSAIRKDNVLIRPLGHRFWGFGPSEILGWQINLSGMEIRVKAFPATQANQQRVLYRCYWRPEGSSWTDIKHYLRGPFDAEGLPLNEKMVQDLKNLSGATIDPKRTPPSDKQPYIEFAGLYRMEELLKFVQMNFDYNVLPSQKVVPSFFYSFVQSSILTLKEAIKRVNFKVPAGPDSTTQPLARRSRINIPSVSSAKPQVIRPVLKEQSTVTPKSFSSIKSPRRFLSKLALQSSIKAYNLSSSLADASVKLKESNSEQTPSLSAPSDQELL